MTEEEFDACDDSVGELLNECQDNCNDSGSFGGNIINSLLVLIIFILSHLL